MAKNGGLECSMWNLSNFKRYNVITFQAKRYSPSYTFWGHVEKRGKMSNYGRTQDGHNRAPYKLHYRTQVNGYRGGGLRRKRSKTVEICGYQFHSHTTYLNPLALQTSPKLSSNLSLSSSPQSCSTTLSLLNHLSINLCKRLSNTTAINNLTIFNHKRYRISTEQLKRISISRTILSPTGFSINSQETPEQSKDNYGIQSLLPSRA